MTNCYVCTCRIPYGQVHKIETMKDGEIRSYHADCYGKKTTVLTTVTTDESSDVLGDDERAHMIDWLCLGANYGRAYWEKQTDFFIKDEYEKVVAI